MLASGETVLPGAGPRPCPSRPLARAHRRHGAGRVGRRCRRRGRPARPRGDLLRRRAAARPRDEALDRRRGGARRAGGGRRPARAHAHLEPLLRQRGGGGGAPALPRHGRAARLRRDRDPVRRARRARARAARRPPGARPGARRRHRRRERARRHPTSARAPASTTRCARPTRPGGRRSRRSSSSATSAADACSTSAAAPAGSPQRSSAKRTRRSGASTRAARWSPSRARRVPAGVGVRRGTPSSCRSATGGSTGSRCRSCSTSSTARGRSPRRGASCAATAGSRSAPSIRITSRPTGCNPFFPSIRAIDEARFPTPEADGGGAARRPASRAFETRRLTADERARAARTRSRGSAAGTSPPSTCCARTEIEEGTARAERELPDRIVTPARPAGRRRPRRLSRSPAAAVGRVVYTRRRPFKPAQRGRKGAR